MDNGFTTSDAVLTSAMSGGFGGRGGAWGGNYGSPFADFGSNAVRLNRNAQMTENQADCTREVLGLGLSNITNAFENADRSAQFTNVKDGQFQSELRTNDRILALQAEVNANARVAADCCCDLKVQAANDKAELLSTMQALSKEGITRDLDRAERENIYLRTVSTCGCGCGGGTTPCPSAS
jgi:hypothetical protein